MKNFRRNDGFGIKRAQQPVLWALALAAFNGSAWAGSFELGPTLSGQYTLTLGYAAAVRTERAADALANGPIDPATGLPTTVNSDDGDRNFKRGALVNNRVSALGELFLNGRNYGLVLRGDAFYDDVYNRRNDNDSPGTVNKSGDNDEFTDAAERRNGARVRLLDAYAYGDFSLGSTARLNARLGRQVVAWGESLFFSGMASAQGPADATKANVPGAELKNILLPVEQLALQLGLNDRLSLMGYYRLAYKPTELEPAGSYFSTSDIVGPGAEFLYVFVNPAAGIPGAPPMIVAPRGDDLEPSDHGQWGVGFKYQLTSATNVGLYRLRYHNTNPSVQVNFGFAELAPGVTTAPTPVPVSYNIRYFDGIEMTAASFSTRVGAANVAGELSYRDGVDLLVNTAAGPTSSRGGLTQLLVSSLLTLSPNALSRQIDLVGEAGYVRASGVDAVLGSKDLSGDRESWAVSGIATLNYRNVFPRWDLAVPITYSTIIHGNPAMSGAFGALYGEHDQRASVAANFTYLQNLQLGVSYNAFLGSPSLSERPYADRDYAAVSVKYSF